MAIVRIVRVVCDDCGQAVTSTVLPNPEAAAEAAAAEWGWLLGEDGEWCPACRGKAFD